MMGEACCTKTVLANGFLCIQDLLADMRGMFHLSLVDGKADDAHIGQGHKA
jgi:hypothetical protein